MKHTAILPCLTVAILLIGSAGGGCASTHLTVGPQGPADLPGPVAEEGVSLTVLGPATPPRMLQSAGSFHLGAGDALGQAIFTNYAAIVRANAGWQYASETSETIE